MGGPGQSGGKSVTTWGSRRGVPPCPGAYLEHRGGEGGCRWVGAGWKRRLGTFQKWKPDELFKGEHILQAAPLLELVRRRWRQLRPRPQPRPDGVDTDNCIRCTRLFSIKRSCWRHNRGSRAATSGRARAPASPRSIESTLIFQGSAN